MPRDVVYGPEKYLGLDHGSLYHTQGAKHIQALMDYGKTLTITGHQIRALVEGHKLELGLGGSLFEKDWDVFGGCATETWVSDTWRYMWEMNIRLEEDTLTLKLLRENDCFLMERFAAYGYTAEELVRLNRCRCHLQAVTLADIVDGNGRQVSADAWSGRQDASRLQRYVWPHQPAPPSRFWEEWRSALELVFQLDKRRSLPTADQLGRWYQDASSPSAVEVQSEGRVYLREEAEKWRVYSKARGRRSRLREAQYTKTDTVVSAPPEDGCWASSWSLRDDLLMLTGSAPVLLSPASTQPGTFLARCAEADPNVRWAIETCRVDDDGAYVAQALRDGTAIAVSDGSFKDETGAAGFVLEGPRYGLHRIFGDCMVSGYNEDQSAYRSELCGLLGIMYTLREICRHHDVQSGSITVACDGLSAIRKALDQDSTFSSRSAQFDLLSAIESVLLELPLQVSWRHVDGHQDEDRIGPLDRWEQLNCAMDALAKHRWQESAETHAPFHDIDGQLWPLFVGTQQTKSAGLRIATGGRAIGNDLSARLADHTLGGNLLRYWEGKEWLGTPAGPHINWGAVGMARSSLSMGHKAWISKFASGHCAVNSRLLQRQQLESDVCTRCNDAVETPAHVLSCPKGDPRFTECASALLRWGQKSGAAPGLMEAVVSGLSQWRRNPAQPNVCLPRRARTPALRRAVQDQQLIGWGAMFFGCQSLHWEQIQADHFRAMGSLRSGRRWVTELIKKLWNTAWDMWTFRSFQVKSGHDEEALRMVQAMDCHIRYVHRLGTHGLPCQLHSLVRTPIHRILRRPVEARLAWLDKIHLGYEYTLGWKAHAVLRGYFRRYLIQGGLLARLRRSKQPPPLRTTDRAPRKALLQIEQDEE